jgi:BlaI family transcriptional regulator, penicillinase repressor
MRKSTPRLTETEWEIMRIIWERHPITATEIVKALIAADPTWHPKTTRAFLNRLAQKKVLRYESQGRSYVYEPLVSERECVAAASESFLERVFGGSLQPMLAHFVEQRRITKKDLQDLNDLLEGRTMKTSDKKGRQS